MPRRAVAVALTALALPLAASAQTVSAPPVSAPPARPLATPAPPPKSAVYSLAALMNFVAAEHARLWYAGHDYNWPLADYALNNIKAALGEAKALAPANIKQPFLKKLAAIAGPVQQVNRAVRAEKRRDFIRAYGDLTASCNDCHAMAGLGFIFMQRPYGRAFPNQVFHR